MPSYADALDAGQVTDEELWQLAHYVRSLAPEQSELGDALIRLRRVTRDSAVAASDTIGFAGGVRTDSLPQARFPHWLHRIRYRCKACHMAIIEPRAGANLTTMKAIGRGELCGRCHDGRAAFRAGFGECQRCHVARAVQR
jgi:c(7)-type cytochrome triheme protein